MNEVLGLATFRMRRELEASVRDDPEVQELLDRVVARELDPASAATHRARAARRGARQVSAALAPPFLVASLVLCVAGLCEAARAGRRRGGARAGAPVGPCSIRALAVGEVALGAACVLHPTRVGSPWRWRSVYGLFAAVARRPEAPAGGVWVLWG